MLVNEFLGGISSLLGWWREQCVNLVTTIFRFTEKSWSLLVYTLNVDSIKRNESFSVNFQSIRLWSSVEAFETFAWAFKVPRNGYESFHVEMKWIQQFQETDELWSILLKVMQNHWIEIDLCGYWCSEGLLVFPKGAFRGSERKSYFRIFSLS